MFYKSDNPASADNGSALVVFFSSNLAEAQSKIETAGSDIIKPIFEFPCGKRFHFTDPKKNETVLQGYRTIYLSHASF